MNTIIAETKASQLANVTASQQWFPNPCKVVKPMSLIVAMQTLDKKIVVAADSLCLTYGNGLGDTTEQYAYYCEKLKRIAATNWILASAGFSVDGFHSELEAEVETGRRPQFDCDIRIGGPIYLKALGDKIRFAAEGMPEEKLPYHPVMLAGFDSTRKPVVLGASLPKYGYFLAPTIYPLGAQEPTANWIMRTLGANCSGTEDVKRLAYFTIWQISKLDVRVGKLESGFPISLCVMSAEGHVVTEKLAALPEWMVTWEANLQTCFARTVSS